MTDTHIPALLLQAAPQKSLIFAMLLSYALGFAGMLLAYLNYRKRKPRAKPPQVALHKPWENPEPEQNRNDKPPGEKREP